MCHKYTKNLISWPFDWDFQRILVATIAICLLTGSGCMRRRITVRTNPPGALLFVDNQEVGLTPASFYVNYYATRDIRLEKNGFKTVVEQHTFRTPWYQIPPLDLISDNFLFREQRDERFLNFALEPMPNVNNRHLIDRANQLRLRAQQGIIIPLLSADSDQGATRTHRPGDGLTDEGVILPAR